MATADFVRTIRKRLRELLEGQFPAQLVRIGMRVERGEAVQDGESRRGTWIDAEIFLPDETCDDCDAPIEPGKEVEKYQGDLVLCAKCAKRR